MISLYLAGTGRYSLQNLSRSVKLFPEWLAVDVEKQADISAALAAYKPQVVVNCVGKLVKESEQNSRLAEYVNGQFPHFLEQQAGVQGYRLIHLSTDCVFSGERGGYTESDATDGKGLYAQSKAMGEVINGRDLTVRTSIIGPELKKNPTGLFHWLMTSRGAVKGYERVFWNGVTTLELAKAIDTFIGAGTAGLCHLTSPEKISKHDLIKLMRDTWGRREPEIKPDPGLVSDKTLVSTRADLPFRPQGYAAQLAELKEWILARREIYAPYL
jgi:dTDP-4-dehydrorhamnose reductase